MLDKEFEYTYPKELLPLLDDDIRYCKIDEETHIVIPRIDLSTTLCGTDNKEKRSSHSTIRSSNFCSECVSRNHASFAKGYWSHLTWIDTKNNELLSEDPLYNKLQELFHNNHRLKIKRKQSKSVITHLYLMIKEDMFSVDWVDETFLEMKILDYKFQAIQWFFLGFNMKRIVTVNEIKFANDFKFYDIIFLTQIIENFTFPTSFFKLKDMHHLQIVENEKVKITHIPESLWNFTNLQFLRIIAPNIETFPSNLSKFTSLTRLEITISPEVNINLAGIKSLMTIKITDMQLEKVPNLSSQPYLKKLELQGNNFEEFNLTFDKNPRLRSLNLRNCNINEFHIESAMLKDIDISNNMLEEIPKCFTKMKINFLNISNNPIENLRQECKKAFPNATIIQQSRQKDAKNRINLMGRKTNAVIGDRLLIVI